MLFILCSSLVAANIYTADTVTTGLDVSSRVDITGSVNSMTADILFVPDISAFQQIKSMETEGDHLEEVVRFRWPYRTGSIDFGYSAVVEVKNAAPRVYSKILYPLRLSGFEEYLAPSPNIDSDHPKIIAQADSLAQGHDDLFILVGEVGRWVKDNVEYNLSTLTADISRPASWVLQNRVGVCDELTALFIAMLRSLDVPARFVSGVAYTDSASFPLGWGAHGWAEVYFPGVGWLPYDPTFGQYGWVDPGHIKMKESVDPQDSTVRVEWRGNADVQVHDLDIDAERLSSKGRVQSPILWSAGASHGNVGFGSYNVIVAEVENLEDYYVAGELSLAKVSELEDYTTSRAFLLRPHERKRLFWKVRVEDLDPDFQYEIPIHIYDVMNYSQRASFAVSQWDVSYSGSEADAYIRSASLDAPPPLELGCVLEKDRLLPGESTQVHCQLENHLGSPVTAEVCYDSCTSVAVNTVEEFSFVVDPLDAGSHDVSVSATAGEHSARSVLTVVRLDTPRISIEDIEIPSSVAKGESFQLAFTVAKQSVANPLNVTVYVSGGGARVELPLDVVSFDQDVVIDIDSDNLYSSSPVFDVRVVYSDAFGNSYSADSSASTSVEGIPWYKSIVGWILGLFSAK